MDAEQERAFVQAFIVPSTQERYLFLLASPKRRRKALNTFYHALPTVSAYTFAIANRDHSADKVEAILNRKGAGPSCYVISPERDLDGREMPLREALDDLIGSDGCGIVCCVPGRLAYYKAELSQYLLEAK